MMSSVSKISSFAEASELFTNLELPSRAKDQLAAEIATRNLASLTWAPTVSDPALRQSVLEKIVLKE